MNRARDDVLRLMQLIGHLEAATGPSRDLDHEIAQVTGWQQNHHGDRVVWLSPDTAEQARVPRYTKFLHDAYYLANQICPDSVGGMAWEPGAGSARIAHHPVVEASSPALALCIAALKIKKERDVATLKSTLETRG